MIGPVTISTYLPWIKYYIYLENAQGIWVISLFHIISVAVH